MTDTRTRIVTTTAALFQRQGFNGTSVKQITEGAEATIGSLYHFFPRGKDELSAEVVRTAGEQYLEMFRLIATADLPAPAAVGLLFDGAAATLEQSDYVDACPIYTVALEVASANESLREACAGVFGSWVAEATSMFRRHGLRKRRAEALAVTVIGALGGAFVLARTAKDADLMRSIGRDMVRLIAAG